MSNVMVVQGCFINTFTVKKDSIKVILKANKDDLRAGSGDVGDIIKSLELHVTAGAGAPISLALLRDLDGAFTTDPNDFIANHFVVKQDDIKIVLQIKEEDMEEGMNWKEFSHNIVKSLAIHSSGGEDKPVEISMNKTLS